jgi:hypothetical protein
LIVTHNHWPGLDSPQLEVQLSDAAGTPIVILSGDAFRSLIRYRDERVIILAAPAGLAAGAVAGDGDSVGPGSLVHVVDHDPATGRLSVIPATVEKNGDYQGVPSLLLRNLNGELIEPGNSGGGVWFGGNLVGAISHTILTPEENSPPDAMAGPEQPTDRSVAARLSPARMPILNNGQPIASR